MRATHDGHTMNNSQFRRLLLSDTPRQDGDNAPSPAAGTPRAVLGARKHSSIPMTPQVLPGAMHTLY
jgi:hypothetical protein